jgi:hypothetical protein
VNSVYAMHSQLQTPALDDSFDRRHGCSPHVRPSDCIGRACFILSRFKERRQFRVGALGRRREI